MSFKGVNLKTIRQLRNMEQEPFARLLGISRQTLSKYENGYDEAGAKLIYAMSIHLTQEESDFVMGKVKSINPENITQVRETKTEYKSVKLKSNAQALEISEDQTLIPIVEVRAQAGYLRGFNDSEFMDTLPKIAVEKPYDRGGNFVAFRNSGDSMDDGDPVTAILDDDILICRELIKTHWSSKISNSHAFVIVHEDGVLCKQIIKQDIQKGIITCHSRNPAPLPEYEDFELKLSEVKQLFYVREVRRSKKIKY